MSYISGIKGSNVELTYQIVTSGMRLEVKDNGIFVYDCIITKGVKGNHG